MVVFAVMFFVLVMGTIMVLWIYKKRRAGDNRTVPPTQYEMEVNPSYKSIAVERTTDTETYVYETLRGRGAK